MKVYSTILFINNIEFQFQLLGTNVKLCGWVSSLRFFGQNLAFLLLRDSYSSVQTVFEFDNTEDNLCLEALKKTPLESVVYIEGN